MSSFCRRTRRCDLSGAEGIGRHAQWNAAPAARAHGLINHRPAAAKAGIHETLVIAASEGVGLKRAKNGDAARQVAANVARGDREPLAKRSDRKRPGGPVAEELRRHGASLYSAWGGRWMRWGEESGGRTGQLHRAALASGRLAWRMGGRCALSSRDDFASHSLHKPPWRRRRRPRPRRRSTGRNGSWDRTVLRKYR